MKPSQHGCLHSLMHMDVCFEGLLLGALLAVGAPAGEMIIVNILGWWHYDRPDLLGVPHWAAWCYAAYGWGVGNVGRYLVNKQKLKSASSEIKSLSSRN